MLMKNNFFDKEYEIRQGFQNAKAPEKVTDRMEETLRFLEESGRAEKRTEANDRAPKCRSGERCRDSGKSGSRERSGSVKKRFTFRKAAVIALAAAVCAGTTAIGANRLYRMQLEKQKKYQANVKISVEETLPQEVAEVEIRVNYLPEGFALDPNKGLEHYYKNPEIADAGYMLGTPYLIDRADPLTVLFARDADTLQINGREAVYVNQQNTSDGEWQNGTIYLVFEEVNRILTVGMWGYADKEELIQIAENVELVPTGEMTASADLPHWSDLIAIQQQEQAENEEILAELSAEEERALTADAEAMENVHQIGEAFAVRSYAGGGMEQITLNASVTDVQILDNLALLEEERIPEPWKELVGEDGKLMPVTLNYVKEGDGADTLDEVVRTEEKPVKLVYAVVEYTNTGDTAVEDAWFFAGLLYLTEENGTYQVYQRTDDSYDYIVNENWSDDWEMGYYNATGGAGNNNYILKIQPGETKTVHMAWLVTEDNLDCMYMDLTGTGALTEEALETGLIELRIS